MPVPRKLQPRHVLALCADYEAGWTMEALSDKYGLHYQNVRLILLGHHYKDVSRPVTRIRRPGPVAA